MNPVGEVEVLIVHADQDVSHHQGHLRKDPALYLLVRNINNLLCSPVTLVCLVIAEHVGKKGRAYKSLSGLGIVEELNIETSEETSRVTPLSGYHHIVIRLVPKVITKS